MPCASAPSLRLTGLLLTHTVQSCVASDHRSGEEELSWSRGEAGTAALVPLKTGVNNHKAIRKQNETRHRERIGKLEPDQTRPGHAERRAGGVESANAEQDWGWWCDEVTVESQSENSVGTRT